MSVTRHGMQILLTEHRGKCQVGGRLFRFVIDGLYAWFQEFTAARGAEPSEPPSTNFGLLNMTDPDGNQWRFMEPSPDAA